MEIEELKARLKEKARIYPVGGMVRRIDEVCRILFSVKIEELKTTEKKELDLCRRKFRAKYYARQYNIELDGEEYIIDGLYEDAYCIITYKK